jgi:hypothetical protein
MQGYMATGCAAPLVVSVPWLSHPRVSDDDGYIKNIAIINYPDTLPVSYTRRQWASITHP